MLEGVLNTPMFRLFFGNVLCHHIKYLMRYFEYLHSWKIICLPLNISEKTILQKKQYFRKIIFQKKQYFRKNHISEKMIFQKKQYLRKNNN